MELEVCRAAIDKIDHQLARLLEERLQWVASVAAYKRAHHMEVYDPRREKIVLDRIAALAPDPDLAPHLRRIYQMIMDESKAYELQRMNRG